MPRAVLTFVSLVTGYLNGAGLGALFFSFYPGASTQPGLHLALIAILILGPAGALAAFVTARSHAFDGAPETLTEK
jgi:hypothetical protein